jgi:hypothetical protein
MDRGSGPRCFRTDGQSDEFVVVDDGSTLSRSWPANIPLRGSRARPWCALFVIDSPDNRLVQLPLGKRQAKHS